MAKRYQCGAAVQLHPPAHPGGGTDTKDGAEAVASLWVQQVLIGVFRATSEVRGG